MSLDAHFSKWYSIVAPDAAPSRLTARRNAIGSLAKSLTMADIPSIIRLFHCLPTADTRYKDTVRKALTDSDDNYVGSNDDGEVAVISGAVLYQAMEESLKVSLAVALAITTADAAGLRKQLRLDDVVVRAGAHLADASALHRWSPLSNVDFSLREHTEGLAKLKEAHADLPTYSAAVDAYLTKVLGALEKTTQSLGRTLITVDRRRREESDISYWLWSRATLQDSVPYAELTRGAACLVAAWDLASLTVDVPGPNSARAFMQSMIVSSEQFTSLSQSIADCVKELGESRGKSIVSKVAVRDPLLQPVSSALLQAEGADGGARWIDAFKRSTYIDPSTKLDLVDLSELFYTELLLSRVLTS